LQNDAENSDIRSAAKLACCELPNGGRLGLGLFSFVEKKIITRMLDFLQVRTLAHIFAVLFGQ
jgi:hypothetical protein